MKFQNKVSPIFKLFSLAILSSCILISGCSQLNFLSSDGPKEESKEISNKSSSIESLSEEEINKLDNSIVASRCNVH